VSTISNFPRGLLDLLGIYTFGKAPSNVGNDVVPTLETLEMFLSAKLVTIGGQAAAPPAGGSNALPSQFTVPANEVWVVKALTAFGVTEAGVTMSISPAVRLGGTGGSIAPTLGRPQPMAASTNMSCPADVVNLWLPSGSEMGIRVDALTGAPTGASTLNLNALVARLKAGA